MNCLQREAAILVERQAAVAQSERRDNLSPSSQLKIEIQGRFCNHVACS
jgi:hypothetical protein